MTPILTTIIPIFAVIFIGWAARQKGFISDDFFEPANRLVFYIGIPAMIFQSVSKASFKTQFGIPILLVALAAMVGVFFLAWAAAFVFQVAYDKRGTFVQSAFHGNLGYIGLAVAYYYLGKEGLIKAGLIAGFMMILQNFLAVVVLQLHSSDAPQKLDIFSLIMKIIGNPIILSALAGIFFVVAGIQVPLVLDRCLTILSGMALPMALLIIGGSITFNIEKSAMMTILGSSILKLLVLPGLGFGLCWLFGVMPPDYIPGIILLASPTATVTYVMAKEMHGVPELAAYGISISTLLSAITFSVWLSLLG